MLSIQDLKRGNVLTEYGWEYLRELATTVQRIHYRGSPYTDDLISIGMVKGSSLVICDREREVQVFKVLSLYRNA